MDSEDVPGPCGFEFAWHEAATACRDAAARNEVPPEFGRGTARRPPRGAPWPRGGDSDRGYRLAAAAAATTTRGRVTAKGSEGWPPGPHEKATASPRRGRWTKAARDNSKPSMGTGQPRGPAPHSTQNGAPVIGNSKVTDQPPHHDHVARPRRPPPAQPSDAGLQKSGRGGRGCHSATGQEQAASPNAPPLPHNTTRTNAVRSEAEHGVGPVFDGASPTSGRSGPMTGPRSEGKTRLMPGRPPARQRPRAWGCREGFLRWEGIAVEMRNFCLMLREMTVDLDRHAALPAPSSGAGSARPRNAAVHAGEGEAGVRPGRLGAPGQPRRRLRGGDGAGTLGSASQRSWSGVLLVLPCLRGRTSAPAPDRALTLGAC